MLDISPCYYKLFVSTFGGVIYLITGSLEDTGEGGSCPTHKAYEHTLRFRRLCRPPVLSLGSVPRSGLEVFRIPYVAAEDMDFVYAPVADLPVTLVSSVSC